MAQTQTIKPIRDFSWGRYLLLGMISLILASSMVLAILAPFPLALATALFGRTKGILLSVLSAAAALTLYKFNIWSGEIVFLYAGCVLFSFILGEILKRNIVPMRGVVVSGAGLFLITAFMLVFGASQLERWGHIPLSNSGELSAVHRVVHNLRTFMTLKMKSVSEMLGQNKESVMGQMSGESKEVLEIFSHPELIIDEVIFAIPSSLFVGIFFALWVNLFFLLRTNRLYHFNSSFTEKDLLNFRMPEMMVWLVVVALVLSIFGEEFLSKGWSFAGKGLIQCLGLFYFFQGFGIFMELLDFLRFQGIFRSLLVVFTIISAWWIIACVGLFDLWFNFRKFFRKKIKQ